MLKLSQNIGTIPVKNLPTQPRQVDNYTCNRVVIKWSKNHKIIKMWVDNLGGDIFTREDLISQYGTHHYSEYVYEDLVQVQEKIELGLYKNKRLANVYEHSKGTYNFRLDSHGYNYNVAYVKSVE